MKLLHSPLATSDHFSMRCLGIYFKQLFALLLCGSLCGCSWGYNPDKDKLKGVVNETITPDEVTHIDARSGARKHSLTFQTTGAHEHGRYLSEYLLLVYNTDEEDGGQPCVRLRFRPDSGAKYSEQEVDFFQTSDSGSCGPEQSAGEENDADDDEEGSERATLTGDVNANELGLLTQPPRFNLKQTKELCSLNVFRVLAPRDGSTSSSNPRLEKIVEKTGRFLAISKSGLVRVWVDEEMFSGRNPCPYIGRPHNDLQDKSFSRITVGTSPGISIFYDSAVQSRPTDHFTKYHLQNIADETEKAYKRLSVLGEVGDVDNNGTIEVFISPEINRRLAYGGANARRIDEMSVLPFYRPFDVQPLDTHRNSLSNEGEIVYLWAPDPAGIYAHHADGAGSPYVVSSNSLTTNYSKGFIGYQLMSLIIWHNKYVKHKIADWQRDNWVRNALSLLASAYIGGIDYSNKFVNNYLFSRTQLVNLRAPETGEGITSDLKALGMLTLFGWYLHARICGTTSDICKELKRFINNEHTGSDNISQVFDEDTNDIFLNFGMSLATHVAERPQEIMALWDKKKENFKIQRPIAMFTVNDITNATEVKPPPQTVERAESELYRIRGLYKIRDKFFAAPDCIAQPSAPLCGNMHAYVAATDRNVSGYFRDLPTAGLADRTHAAPFLYEDMYNFWHVLMPDSELDFRTRNNTVAAVLISGFTNNEMELLANIGRGLQLIIVPLGERDRGVRALFKEKEAEFAHLSVRPVNLTGESQEKRRGTIYELVESPFADMSSYEITPDRQLWIAGSNENFTVDECADEECEEAEATTSKQVGDSDAYGILFDPCPKNNRADCENYKYRAIIQVKARDYQSSGHNEYKPFILATAASRDLFDGKSILGYASRIGYENDDDVDPALCLADATGVCPGAGTPDKSDDQTVYDPSRSDSYHRVDNFFHSSYFYPQEELNFGTMLPAWMARVKGRQRLFMAAETVRQFHTFKLPPNEELEANELKFLPVANPVGGGVYLSSELTNVSSEELFGIFKDAVCEAQLDAGAEECSHADLEYSTANFDTIAAEVTLTAAMEEQFTESRYVCGYKDGDGCPSSVSVLSGQICPLFDEPVGIASCDAPTARMLRYYPIDGDQTINTLYEPSLLDWEMFEAVRDKDMPDPSCFFSHGSHRPGNITACRFDIEQFTAATSILQQIDATIGEVGCLNNPQTYLYSHNPRLNHFAASGGKLAKVCLARLVRRGQVGSDHHSNDRSFLYLPRFLQNHRRRLRRYTHLPSEILAAEGYIDVIQFKLAYDQSIHDNRKSLINLIVGGLNDSEGKYLIRVKLVRESK